MWLPRVLVSLYLAAKSCQQILSRENDNATLYSRDSVQVNVSELFDLSLAVGDVAFSPSTGRLVTKDTPFGEIDLTGYGFASVDFVHFIDNQTYVAIFDEAHILVHTVNLDGASIYSEVKQDFLKPGKNIKCSDMDINREMSRLYLACFSRPTDSDDGFMFSTPSSPTQSRRSRTRSRMGSPRHRRCSRSCRPTL